MQISQRNKNIENILLWAFVIIAPLYSLPFVCVRMYKLERSAFFQFAFLMGLIGMLVPPTGDFYRYTRDYYIYQELSWNQFVIYALTEFDFLLAVLSYFLGSLNIPFDISRFIFNFSAYCLLGDMYIKIMSDERNERLGKHDRLYALLFIFILNIDLYLSRNGFGTVLFCYGALLAYYFKEKKGWIFLALSVFCHFSFLPFVLLIIVLGKRKKRFSRNGLIILFIISLFLSGEMFADIINKLPLSPQLVERYIDYVFGYYNGEYQAEFSSRLKLWTYINRFFIFILLVVYFIKYKKHELSITAIVNTALLLCILVSPLPLPYTRFLSVLMLCLRFAILILYTSNGLKPVVMRRLMYMMIIVGLLNLWGARRQIAVSDMDMMFTSSSYNILTHTYDQKWTDRNVGSLGEILEFE